MFDNPHRTSPERKLWQSVLLRQVEDALYMPETDKIPAERARLREEARIFLTRPSRDLSMVCNLAGLNMQPVIDRMLSQTATTQSPGMFEKRNRSGRYVQRNILQFDGESEVFRSK